MVAQAAEKIGDDLRQIAIAMNKHTALSPGRKTINLRIAWFLTLLGFILVQCFLRNQTATTDDLLGLLFTWLIFAGGSTVEHIREQLRNVRSGVESRVGLE